jgi:hypothetical protein
LFAGVGSTLAVTSNLPGFTWADAKVVLQECESTLPRNQNCVLTAIPNVDTSE